MTGVASAMASFPKEGETKGGAKDQLLVQCPACQTKFGVDSSLVAEFPVPRFHCSRCDHVFEVEHYRLFPRQERGELQASPEAVNALTNDSAPSLAASITHRGLSVPRTFDPSLSIAAPHERQEVQQMRLDLPSPHRVGSVAAGRDVSDRAEADWKLGDTQELPESGAEIEIEGDAWSEEYSALRPRLAPPSWQGFVWIAGPVMVALAVCLFVGYAVVSNPRLGAQLFAGAFESSPKTPPAGVLLEETGLERITLESGDSLYAVRAVLRNGSSQRVRGIVVEGALFSPDGEMVVQRRVPANSTLARTRIKSLTLEMVEDLQGREHTKALVLDPGERHEVLIALPQPPGANVKSFVARVYSVS